MRKLRFMLYIRDLQRPIIVTSDSEITEEELDEYMKEVFNTERVCSFKSGNDIIYVRGQDIRAIHTIFSYNDESSTSENESTSSKEQQHKVVDDNGYVNVGELEESLPPKDQPIPESVDLLDPEVQGITTTSTENQEESIKEQQPEVPDIEIPEAESVSDEASIDDIDQTIRRITDELGIVLEEEDDDTEVEQVTMRKMQENEDIMEGVNYADAGDLQQQNQTNTPESNTTQKKNPVVKDGGQVDE